jgi:hypothetical protein
MTDLLHFINRIEPAGLRRAPLTVKSTWEGGESPYKVLLLISIILAMHRQKAFRGGIVYYNDCLPLFKEVYSILYGIRSEGIEHKIVQPFWYFGSGRPRIWRLVAQEGKVSELNRAIAQKKQLTTEKMLKGLVQCAEIDAGDHDLLHNSTAARAIIFFLAGQYLSTHAHFHKILSLTKTLK